MAQDYHKQGLPKPVTITGSAYPDPDPDVADNDDDALNTEDSTLPEPVAFGDDEGDEEKSGSSTTPDDDKQNLTENPDQSDMSKPPLGAILPNSDLPQIESASSDPIRPAKDDSHSNKPETTDASDSFVGNVFSLPQIPTTEPELPEVQSMTEPPTQQTDNLVSQTEPVNLPPLDNSFLNPADDNQVPQQNAAYTQNNQSGLPNLSNMSSQVPAEVGALDGHIDTAPATAMPQYNVSTPDQPPAKPSNGLNKVLLGAGVFMVGAGIIVGGYFGLTAIRGKSSEKPPVVAYEEPVVTPRPIQTPDASSSATPRVNPSASPKTSPSASSKPVAGNDIKIQILNGSGKKGDALIAKDLIESSKYAISTGNADNFDYVGLTIEYKKDQEEVAQDLASLLEKTYGDATLESTLKASDDYDVIITLGSNTASATPKPASSPSPEPES